MLAISSNPTLVSSQAKLVKQEQHAIDMQYEKKRKGAEVAQKMSVVYLVTEDLLINVGLAHNPP
jgi:V-type H+-transporting ATPase subunit E